MELGPPGADYLRGRFSFSHQASSAPGTARTFTPT